MFPSELQKSVGSRLKPTFSERILVVAKEMKRISAGAEYSLFINQKGQAWGCGQNTSAQLGLGFSSECVGLTEIPAVTNATLIAASTNHTFFLDIEGNIWGCGANDCGELGFGDFILRDTPEINKSLRFIKQIGGGLKFSMFLSQSGEVFSCGYNGDGQLGLNDHLTRNIPTAIHSVPAIKSISTGNSHYLLLDRHGVIWSGGLNSEGQLGHGDKINKNFPTKISALPKIRTMSAGGSHSLFVDKQNFAYACGNNQNLRLGIGSTSSCKSTPTKLSTLKDIIKVSAGNTHSLFLDTSGKVWCCGNKGMGRLGIGAIKAKTTPISIPNLPPIKLISAGDHHSLFLDQNNTIWVTGSNNFTQLGFSKIILPTTTKVPIGLTEFNNIVTLGDVYKKLESPDIDISTISLINDNQTMSVGMKNINVIENQVLSGEIDLIGWNEKWSKIHEEHCRLISSIEIEATQLEKYQQELLRLQQMIAASQDNLFQLNNKKELSSFYDSYLEPISEVENKLKGEFLSKLENPRDFSVKDVSIFLSYCQTKDFIPIFRKKKISGANLFDYVSDSQLQLLGGKFDILTRRKYQSGINLLKNKLFLNKEELDKCSISRNLSPSRLNLLLIEYGVNFIDKEFIVENKIDTLQFMLFSKDDLGSLFPGITANESETLENVIQMFNSSFTEFLQSLQL